MPGDACLKAPELIAVVTITWSPQTIGEDQPRPGTSAFQPTLMVVDHFVGSVSIAEIARPDGPRNCGQVRSGGAGASGTSVVMNSSSGRRNRTAEVYTRDQPLPSFGINLRLCVQEYRIRDTLLSQGWHRSESWSSRTTPTCDG